MALTLSIPAEATSELPVTPPPPRALGSPGGCSLSRTWGPAGGSLAFQVQLNPCSLEAQAPRSGVREGSPRVGWPVTWSLGRWVPRGARDGTSNARPWQAPSWAPRWTSTEAASTSGSPTTTTSWRSRR